MRGLFAALADVAVPLRAVLEIAMALVLFALMALTCVDVVGRYFLRAPVIGSDELIALGMAVIIFGGLPLVAARREQITVDILDAWFRAAPRRVALRDWAVALVSAVALAYLSLRLGQLAGRQFSGGDYSTLLRIPYGPVSAFMSAAAAVAALVTLVLPACAPARSGQG